MLAFLYFGFIVAGSILYAVYTHDSNDENGLFKSALKGVFLIIIGALITMLILHIKDTIVVSITEALKNKDSKYLIADSTTTVIGETTSPMKLTNTN